MPATHFFIKWPDGEKERCYSPSTIIHQYLEEGGEYSVVEFENLCDQALSQASERVRAKYGYACSSALDQLALIKRKTQQNFKGSTGTVMVLHMDKIE